MRFTNDTWLRRAPDRWGTAFPFRALFVCLLMCLLACVRPARADYAIVIGVGKYPRLLDTRQLGGPINDARAVADLLTKPPYKFPEKRVILLLDEQATHDGILDELKKAARAVREDERFVFYFAGHGTKDPVGIVPHDGTTATKPRAPALVIIGKELNALLLNIKTRSRTVILDSCFSGGVATSRSTDLVSRFAGPEAAKPEEGSVLTPRSDTDPNAPPIVIKGTTPQADGKPGGLRLIAAAQATQEAFEKNFGGSVPDPDSPTGRKPKDPTRVRGLFTKNLLEQRDLLQTGTLIAPVVRRVGANVEKETDKLQLPFTTITDNETLLPAPNEVLDDTGGGMNPEQKPTAEAKKIALDLWQTLYLQRPNPENLQTELFENILKRDAAGNVVLFNGFPDVLGSSTLRKSEVMRECEWVGITATPRRDGWLLLIVRDPQDEVRVVFPQVNNPALCFAQHDTPVEVMRADKPLMKEGIYQFLLIHVEKSAPEVVKAYLDAIYRAVDKKGVLLEARARNESVGWPTDFRVTTQRFNVQCLPKTVPCRQDSKAGETAADDGALLSAGRGGQ